jgi:hypothetical protein
MTTVVRLQDSQRSPPPWQLLTVHWHCSNDIIVFESLLHRNLNPAMVVVVEVCPRNPYRICSSCKKVPPCSNKQQEQQQQQQRGRLDASMTAGHEESASTAAATVTAIQRYMRHVQNCKGMRGNWLPYNNSSGMLRLKGPRLQPNA